MLMEKLTYVEYKANIKRIKIKYNNSELDALKGEIFIDFSSLEESYKESYFELISSIKFLGIGDRIQDGMGQVKIIE